MLSDKLFSEAIGEQHFFSGRKNTNSDLEAIHIGYGIDDNFARCMGASITSICLNNQESNLVFHVLASGLKKDNLMKLEQLAHDFHINIHVYAINAQVFSHLPIQVQYPVSIYYRLILPSILNVPKVLYLDADIICLQNIQALFIAELEDKIVAAVPDLESTAITQNSRLGLDKHAYFNSGVLLIGINKWNSYNVADKALALLAKGEKKFGFPDQDALNVVLTGKIHYLGREWNRINEPQMMEEGIRFLHFAAKPKPWSIAWNLSDLCNDFTSDIYSKYENLSPWKNSQPELPKNYKEMRYYARCLLKAKDYKASLRWYGRYVKNRITEKFAGNR